MKLGIQFFPDPGMQGDGRNLWDAVASHAQAADESGLDSFWIWDHLMRRPAAGEADSQGMLECFVALGGVAAITRRVLIGQLVTAVPYRNPALVAKMATSLDVMSHGRSVLGLGAGWDRVESAAYGMPLDDVPTRMRRLEEAVQLTLALWKQRPANFSGRFYSLEQALNDPIAPTVPHPPLMVGGSGEKVTLRICAQYADWCNLSGSPETVAGRIRVLREHCGRLGRNPAELTYSNYLWAIIARSEAEADQKRAALGGNARPFYGVVGTPETLVTQLGEFARVGSEHCILQLTGECDPEMVRLLGEQVAPALGALEPLRTV